MDTSKRLPPSVRPVAYRGVMTKDGYRPENYEFRDLLCERDEYGLLVGRDPMTLPLDVLNASGHVQTAARGVVGRLKAMHGIYHPDDLLGWFVRLLPQRLTQIRQRVCLPCSGGNKAEIRRCAIYDCPAWAFRMGRNPHSPARGRNAGINPFVRTG